MKTKYILHGGFKKGSEPVSDPFYTEMLEGTPQSVKVLLVYFAIESDRITKNRDEDVAQFNKLKGNKYIEFELANEEDFLNQIKRADIVYFHGGKTVRLMSVMKKFGRVNWKMAFNGKVVAGDSAGANMFAVVSYSLTSDSQQEGLGVLPIKLIPHFAEEYKDKLNDTRSELKTMNLREYELRTYLV